MKKKVVDRLPTSLAHVAFVHHDDVPPPEMWLKSLHIHSFITCFRHIKKWVFILVDNSELYGLITIQLMADWFTQLVEVLILFLIETVKLGMDELELGPVKSWIGLTDRSGPFFPI
jgi:hypothetical protein